MSSKVLVSFLGTGGRAEGGEKKEYEKTKYVFPQGETIESSLITSALFKFIKPKKLIVIGTSQSVWSQLIEILPKEEESLEYERIFEEVWGKGDVKISTLKGWEEFLSKKLGKEVSLRLVTEDDTIEIVEILYEEILPNASLYLDITHLFRHYPLVASFLVPILRYIKNLKDINIVYGKLKRNAPSKIVFLEEPNKLVNLLEAVALVKHTGNFEKFSEILGLKDLEKLYLKMETNSQIRKNEVNSFRKKVELFKKGNVYERISYLALKKEVFPYLEASSVEERMVKRALFFAKRKQFVKAYTLMIEALKSVAMQIFKIQNRDNAFKSIVKALEINLSKEDAETYKTINSLRNTIAHANPDKKKKIQEILSSEKKLIHWIKKGEELFYHLVGENK